MHGLLLPDNEGDERKEERCIVHQGQRCSPALAVDAMVDVKHVVVVVVRA